AADVWFRGNGEGTVRSRCGLTLALDAQAADYRDLSDCRRRKAPPADTRGKRAGNADRTRRADGGGDAAVLGARLDVPRIAGAGLSAGAGAAARRKARGVSRPPGPPRAPR